MRPHPISTPRRWQAATPLAYLAVAVLCIYGSEFAVGWLFDEDVRAMAYATFVKGTLVVAAIATLLYVLRRRQHELSGANQRLEQKVAELTQEVMEARVRAESADRAKSMFLTSMSHELRSPLHSIIGFTSVLLDGLEGEVTPSQQGHLRVISEASYRLLAIINDLLEMSTIEAGAIALEIKPLPISRPLDRIVRRFTLQARQKGLDLRLESPDADICVDGDERRIEQIIGNLVANAIKYTPSGTVTVISHLDTGHLRIDVRDTGPGIAAEDQCRLFKHFSTLKAERGAPVEGTGLGLAIAAGLAAAMGGKILLQSEPGVGSTFSLLLPIKTEVSAPNDDHR